MRDYFCESASSFPNLKSCQSTSLPLGKVFHRLASGFVAGFLIIASVAQPVEAQDGLAPLINNPGPAGEGVIPASYSGSYSGGGVGYSKALDTVLRVRYNTQSYGQEAGNLDLGTFKAFSYGDDALSFIDAQVTLSDKQGVGYNVGTGIRFLHDTGFSPDPMRVMGVSIWADGSSTEADNFFAQGGVSWESLGDLWDFRINGYSPLGKRFLRGTTFETGAPPAFIGNDLALPTLTTSDIAFFGAEAEAARRLGDREAWGFAGLYLLNNGRDDTTGYQAGVRGYAVPDILVQFKVSNDDIFKTNATFALTWFVGRTRTDYCATCSVLDRLREPVMRNNYVTIQTTQIAGGNALTDVNGERIRMVHVDSSAADDGDGTFENPLNNLDAILANSGTGDIVLAHADSTFTGQNAILQDNQRFLGEGGGIVHSVVTAEEGTVVFPETATDALNGTKPTIFGAVGSAVTLADSNEVNNFLIDGNNVTTTAIFGADANGVTDPTLTNLMIQNIAGVGIDLLAGARVDTDDADGDGDSTELRVPFDVVIDNIMFDAVAVNDIRIDGLVMNGGVPVDPNDADFEGNINISNITSTNNAGTSLLISNLQEDEGNCRATIDNYNYDGGIAGLAGMLFTNIDREINLTNYTASNGTGAAATFRNVDAEAILNISNMTYDGGTGTANALVFDNVDSTNGTAGVTVTASTFTGGTGNGIDILNDSDGIFNFGDLTGTTTVNENSFTNIGGTVFNVEGNAGATGTEFTGQLTVADNIDNVTGAAVAISDVNDDETDGNFAVNFTGNITHNGDVAGGRIVSVVDSVGDQVAAFGGNITVTTTDADAIFLNNQAAGSNIDFQGDLTLTTTGTGRGFVATNAGMIAAAAGTNTITAGSGTALTITGTDILGAVNFEEVNQTTLNGAVNAILLTDITAGDVHIGVAGDTNGAGGTIASTTGDAISITNVAEVEIFGVTVNQTGASDALSITDSNGTDMAVVLDDLILDGGRTGINVVGDGGADALNLTVTDTNVTTSQNTGIAINNVDAGTTLISRTTVDGNGQAGTAGIGITNSNADITIDAGSEIREISGTAFDVSGGSPNITANMDINNTAGQSIEVTGITGGTVTHSVGAVTDTADGINIAGNSGGLITLNGTYDLDTDGSGDAVTIIGNTGADIAISNLDVVAFSGRKGFVATGGGNLTVGGTTNITSTNATAVEIEGMNIGINGVGTATFSNVDSTGAATAIDIQNTTGNLFTVVGGTLNTTGDSILLRDVENVSINGVDITSTGGRGIFVDHTVASTDPMNVTLNGTQIQSTTGAGLDVNANSGAFSLNMLNITSNEQIDVASTGTSTFDVAMNGIAVTGANILVDANNATNFNMTVRDTTVNTLNNTVAFMLDVGINVSDANITFNESTSGTTSFQANDAVAFLFNADSNTTVDFLMDGVTMANSSASSAAEIFTTGTTELNATVSDSTFTNTGAGLSGEFASNGNSSFNLNINDTITTGGGIDLNENGASNFRVQDFVDINANNPGATLTPSAGVSNFIGTVQTP